jgi:ABC-type antimicrobial peptide transport system permease subunit
MTHGGLKRMLNLESIMASAKSLIIGLPIAAALTFLAHRFILFSFEITYNPPIAAIIQASFAVFLITWATMRFAALRLRDENIVENIRSMGGA